MSKKMVKHDGYRSVVCKHHRDIMVCRDCDVLKGAVIVDRGTLWQKLRNPIGWWRVRQQIKRLMKDAEREL